jgi:hypothetical protein
MNQKKKDWAELRSLTEQIKLCDAQGLVTPSLAMSFICIDAMASLARPLEKGKVTRKDFIDWCDKYLKSNFPQQYQYSGKDVYAARCALLHTYGTTAELHEKPNIVKFLYHDCQSHTHQLYAEESMVAISSKSLVIDVCNAVESFIAECTSDSALGYLVISRTDEVITVVPYSARS